LNAPVLRLAYGSDGLPAGIDLLSGERVTHARDRQQPDCLGHLRKADRIEPYPGVVIGPLKQLQAWGAYLLFLVWIGRRLLD